MLGMSMVSNATQRILSQSNNISYTSRGVYRVATVPEDRKAEYLFRDFFMTLVTAYLTELSFRITETYYTMPLLTDKLGLNRLSEIYANDWQKIGTRPVNYDKIPDFLRKRILGSLVREDSNYLIASLLEKEAVKKAGEHGLAEKLPEALRKQTTFHEGFVPDKVLIHHLRRTFNFKEHLTRSLVEIGELSQGEADAIAKLTDYVKGSQGVLKDILEHHKPKGFFNLKAHQAFEHRVTAILNQVEADVMQGVKSGSMEKAEAAVKGIYEHLLEELDEPVKKEYLDKVASGKKKPLSDLAKFVDDDGAKLLAAAKEKAGKLMGEFFENGRLLGAMKKAQKTSAWPKMAVSIALNLVFYGIIANKFDFEKLQPWQGRLNERRGTTQEVVAPAYKAMVPGTAVLVALLQNKRNLNAIKNMGYILRFAVAGGLGLLTYMGSWYAMFKKELAGPPPEIPQDPSIKPVEAATNQLPVNHTGSLSHNNIFSQFETSRRSG